MTRSSRTGDIMVVPPACRASCRRDRTRRAHHDQMLRVETDPDALLELFDMAVTWAELDYPSETMIPPAAWLDFAQRHCWEDPERVLRIFSLATDVALRPRLDAPAPLSGGIPKSCGVPAAPPAHAASAPTVVEPGGRPPHPAS